MKADWEIKKLGEVGKIFSGNSINEKEKKSYMDLSKEGLFYVATKDISDSNIDYENGVLIPNENISKFKIAHKNSVLICAEGGSAGRKFAFNSEYDICFVNKLFAFEANTNVLPEFVFYYYQSDIFSKAFKERLSGLIGGVSLQKFKEIPISFPPLSEQKRIVEILDQKFAQIETLKNNAQKNLQNAKDLFQAELTKAFSNDSWEKKRLGEVCEIRPSKTETIKKLKQTDMVSFLPMEDLQIMNYYIKAKQSKKLIDVVGSYTCFADGDILLAKVTPCFENGKQGIARNLLNGIGFGSSEYIVFRPRTSVISEYIYYVLATSKFREEGKKNLLGACGLKRLSKDYVNTYEIPLPPLSEQQKIVAHLDALQEKVRQLEAIYTKQIANCDELKQSLLQKAFEGEL